MELRVFDLRAEEGRVLTGIAIRYGDVARLPWGDERIQPGALTFGDVVLNRQHSRALPLARTGGGGMVLTDSPEALTMRAELADTTDGRDVYALVRAGVMKGLSTEFIAEAERFEGRLRIIDRAKLVGLSVVDTAAYPDSVVQARARALQDAPCGPPRRVVW